MANVCANSRCVPCALMPTICCISHACAARFISLSLWTTASRGTTPVPAFLRHPNATRLRPLLSSHRLRAPAQTTPSYYCAALGRGCREILGELSYLSRSRPRGLDAARWSTLPGNPRSATRRSPTGRCPDPRPRQRPEATPAAFASRNDPGVAELSAAGKASDQLTGAVCFLKGATPRATHDCRRTPLSVPLSPASE